VQRDGSDEVTFLGAYGYLSYFLTGEHIPWDRETGQLGRVKPFENFFLVRQQDGGVCSGLGAWEVCIRYSYCDLTDGDIAGGVSSEVTLGLNWYWNEWSRMQFNYVHGTIIDHEPVDGYTDADFDILGMRLAMFF
jgi:phosphate-selective porin OprO/OprP